MLFIVIIFRIYFACYIHYKVTPCSPFSVQNSDIHFSIFTLCNCIKKWKILCFSVKISPRHLNQSVSSIILVHLISIGTQRIDRPENQFLFFRKHLLFSLDLDSTSKINSITDIIFDSLRMSALESLIRLGMHMTVIIITL